MRRRDVLRLAGGSAGFALVNRIAHGAEPLGIDQPVVIPAPADPARWPEFRAQLTAWRSAARQSVSYDDALYRRPDFDWITSNFSCGFVMLCDEAFYGPSAGAYTAEAFLDEGVREFGGYDSIVLWHAYPRIGLDDRNQFDFYRDMPGGLDGFENLLVGFCGVAYEAGELGDPFVEVSEADRVGVGVGEHFL